MERINPEGVVEGLKQDDVKEEWRAGLWKKQAKSGLVYLNGRYGDYWISYFKNTRPENTPEGKRPADGTLKMTPTNEGEEKGYLPQAVFMYAREAKSGTKYHSGLYKGWRFMIFENSNKRTPKAPDFNLLVVRHIPKVQHEASVTSEEMKQQIFPGSDDIPFGDQGEIPLIKDVGPGTSVNPDASINAPGLAGTFDGGGIADPDDEDDLPGTF